MHSDLISAMNKLAMNLNNQFFIED